jgi:hypothetical protein
VLRALLERESDPSGQALSFAVRADLVARSFVVVQAQAYQGRCCAGAGLTSRSGWLAAARLLHLPLNFALMASIAAPIWATSLRVFPA